jgi:hypothetical protein
MSAGVSGRTDVARPRGISPMLTSHETTVTWKRH